MEKVWIVSEHCWGVVIKRHASFCIVRYFADGMFHEEIIESDDLLELEDMGLDYESEEFI